MRSAPGHFRSWPPRELTSRASFRNVGIMAGRRAKVRLRLTVNHEAEKRERVQANQRPTLARENDSCQRCGRSELDRYRRPQKRLQGRYSANGTIGFA
jgi:NMD protein affecting ribosome stability and mRNA decay